MKVHIVSPILSRYGGGVFTVIKELYGQKSLLVKKNIDFFLWGFKDDFCEEDSKSIIANKTFVLLKGLPANKIFYSSEFKNKFRDAIGENDVVHLHSLWQYPSFLLTQFKRDKKFKKIISIHGMLDPWALNNNKMQKAISMFLYEKKNLQTADCLHALCEQEYIDIRKLVPKVPIAIIPNGIHLPETFSFKKEYNEVKKILFLGRIHPKKGIENLLKAWRELENGKWKLIIAGVDEDDHERYLKQLSIKLGLKNIEFTGAVFGKEKEKLLISSDAFILPSLSEGLPMSVLEAWSYKLPVLMTPQCNLEVGYDIGAAIKIDTTVSGVQEGLIKLFNSTEEDLNNIGIKGFELVKSEYTWDKVGSKMEELYLWIRGEIEKPDFVKL